MRFVAIRRKVAAVLNATGEPLAESMLAASESRTPASSRWQHAW
jgi:hypothetical protein